MNDWTCPSRSRHFTLPIYELSKSMEESAGSLPKLLQASRK